MEELDDLRKESMGLLHNELVAVVDKTNLTPPEVILVLNLLSGEIESVFARSVRGE